MKDGKNSFSINFNLLTEKTSFEKLEENLKHSIFGVLFVLLKNQDFSMWTEIILIILQLLQFMSFAFSKVFASIWKQEETYTQISNFLQYFKFVVFFQDNEEMYLIVFYICICLIILVIINIVYVSISFSRNKFNIVWPLRVLRSLVSFLVSVLFLPIFDMFISIFNCVNSNTIPTSTTNISTTTTRLLQTLNSTNTTNTTNSINSTIDDTASIINSTATTTANAAVLAASGIKVNIFAPSMECWAGAFYIHAIFSIIVSICFVIICIIVQMTYFETKTSTHNHSAKSNSSSDVFMLISKILILLVFGFFGSESNQWILICVLFFLSAIMFFSYYEDRPFYNTKMMKVYLIVTGIFLWNTTCLLIGKVLEDTIFDGCLPMFFIGAPIIIVIISLSESRGLTLLMTNINKFEKGEKVQKQIRHYLELVDKKDIDRESRTILKGYIFLYEENCTLTDCALKKYIFNYNTNNIETIAFLLQHAETLYQNGISKFPNCTSLRISYAFFLLERLNKKQQANIELVNAEKYSPRFDEQFIIYRYKKLIEEQSTEVGETEENLDVVSNIAYKNHFNQFKNCITKVATLYMDFWSLLLNPNQDNQEDLAKLNDYGSKINNLVEEINNHFDKMQKLKHNDQEVIRCYADFLYDILNDKEKANSYKSRLNEIEGAKQNYDDMNLLNIDVNALSSSDEYQYIILSAQPDKLGVITNISLGVCTLFGYARSEIVGKNIEFVMPEVYHRHHKNILMNKINDYRKNNFTGLQTAKSYKPVFKDIYSFGKNKSRYLIPVNFKVAYLPNEEQNDSVFVAKISSDTFNMGVSQQAQTCYVLVNQVFVIQSFTANSVSTLGLNSNAINNGTMDILKFIKEFGEEFSKLDLDDKTPEQIMALKKLIIANRFKNTIPITWKMYENAKGKSSMMPSDLNNYKSEMNSIDRSTMNNVSRNNTKYFGKALFEVHLNLNVTDLFISGRNEGYIFRFDSMNQEAINNYLNSSNVTNNKTNESSITHTQFMKRNLSNTLLGNHNPPELSAPEVNLKIDKSFIPESANHFMLDTKKMSYVMNPKNVNEIKDFIKDEAIKKIKKEPTIKESEENSSESQSDSDYSYSQSQSGNNSQSEKSLGAGGSSNSNLKKKLNDEYYMVNLNPIKFLIYDFKKETLVEIIDNNKISQMEVKRNEDHRKKELQENSKEGGGAKKPGENSNGEANGLLETQDENELDAFGKEVILIKQIEYALSKEENQPTITRMKWISFIIFLIFIALASVFLALFLSSLGGIQENIKLIYNSYTLITNTVYSLFHTRELVLLNNPKYTNIYQERSEYILNNTNTLLDLFAVSHELLTNIITTSLPISTDNDNILNNSTITTFILEDDLNVKGIQLTLTSSFIETNTALYHIAHQQISEIYPTSKDVYFFIYNSINSIYLTLFKHAAIFLSELGINIEANQFVFLYIFLSALGFAFISYFLISFAYLAVGKRKESYLEVFFEIGDNVIRNSLEKCENFQKKFQSENASEEVSNLDEAEMINDQVLTPAQNTKQNRTSGHKKRKNNNSREEKIVKIKLVIGLFFISLFYFLMYFIYQNQMGNFGIYLNIYDNVCKEQAYYLVIFNVLREYFFDYTTDVFQINVLQYMDTAIDDIYKFRLQRDNFTYLNKDYFPSDYKNLYDEIMNKNICGYAGDIFTTYLQKYGITCNSFVSNSSSYGLNILLTNYFEEIRIGKYRYDLLMKEIKANTNSTFNNTLFNSPYANVLISDQNQTNPGNTTTAFINNNNYYNSNPNLDPFSIFNENSIRNIALVNRFLLRPAYEALKTQLESTINDSINTFKTIYIIILSIFLAIIFIFYLFVWVPFENALNTTIYKTKNMLSIIPKEVLAGLSNIHKLLDIGQNLTKNKKKAPSNLK